MITLLLLAVMAQKPPVGAYCVPKDYNGIGIITVEGKCTPVQNQVLGHWEQCTSSATNTVCNNVTLKPLGPYTMAVNVAAELRGEEDKQPTTWGLSGAYPSVMLFHPPEGYKVKILKVEGDLIAFPSKCHRCDAFSGYAEVGWGLKTTKPDGSTRVTYPGYTSSPYDNTGAWVQDSISAQKPNTRVPVSFSSPFYLEDDNILISQMFVALNTTDRYIHLENTDVITYEFEAK